jgi:hypothetical protein
VRWQGRLLLAVVVIAVACGVYALVAEAIQHGDKSQAEHKQHQKEVEHCRIALSHLEAFDNLVPGSCAGTDCGKAERSLRQTAVTACRSALREP